MRYLIRLIFFIVLFSNSVWLPGQAHTSLRRRVVNTDIPEWKLDTLAMVPGTFFLLRSNGDTVPAGSYSLTGWNSTLILLPDAQWGEDTILLAKYRVFPFSLQSEYKDERLKPEKELRRQSDLSYLYTPMDQPGKGGDQFFNFGELQKSGSISRAISIGSNQDAVLNSTMNLQLSGELAPGITVVAAITDNTIPVQPEGTSQQLREFDKVFIKATARDWEVVAGDFEIAHGAGEFLRFNKRAQGALFASSWSAGKGNRWKFSSRAAGAVAKGKYGNTSFSGVEGNQGPYQLRGANNESFIVVLAGSEKIYLDGKLLARGANNDYVIDYNSAQVTFTSSVPVTKDKRFVAFYEYAERYYNRSMLYVQQEAAGEKLSLRLQYYREADIRSQPVNQEKLLEENRGLLGAIGDDISKAVVNNVKEVPFSNSEVLYKRIDTLVGFTLYDSVYVYSTSADSARYRLGFTHVGPGRGNYIQVNNAANGKVFMWLAPLGGTPQGEYEPVILLVTPKTQQMVTLSGAWQVDKKLKFFFETAVSGSDLNTFSNLGDDDNTGLALMAGLSHRMNPGRGDTSHWVVETDALYRLVNKRFTIVERFRDIEYERDWNITATGPSGEHYGKMQVKLGNRQFINALYSVEPLVRSRDDYSLRHSTAIQSAAGKWSLQGRGSLMTSENTYLPNSFLRHYLSIDRKAGAWLFGIMEEGEENRQYLPEQKDTLYPASFAFRRWQASMERADTAMIRFRLKGGQRYDLLPQHTGFANAYRADELWGGMGSAKIPAHRFDLNIGYRKLRLSGLNPGKGPEESLLGRAEYNHRFWKGLIRGTLFYEFGSGLEYKKEFTYLEVAPGQGVYTWKDYNGDSIKQLDEFEVAVFQDEASFIRIFTPTNQYERVYTMQYNQSLQLEPATVANREKALGRFVSRFSDQGNYRVEQKVGGDNLFGALDPWLIDMENPALINLSYSLRNTLFFNRSNAIYGIDYTVANNRSKLLLVNGFEERAQLQHILRGRWNIAGGFILRTEGSTGARMRHSGFFTANDYMLSLRSATIELQYQPGTKYRIGVKYQYSDKTNTRGTSGEKAVLHRGGAEFRYSIPMKGSLQAQLEYIGILFNSEEESSIAFEMLEGLSAGNNFTWTLGYQRILANNMQVGIQYNGRKASGNPIVHVGSLQVRAFF